MFNRITTAALLLGLLLFGAHLHPAYAQTAAQAPGYFSGSGADSGQGDIFVNQDGSGFGGNADTDTGQGSGEQQQNFPDITDQTSTEPDSTTVTEKAPDDDKHKLGPAPALGTEVQTSARLDPREVTGSSMFNNLRERLRRFGSDFFARARSDSLVLAPVGPNYVVAPGDEVRINLWGYSEIRASVYVDRDGTLNLPQAGTVTAAGLTFGQLEKVVENAYRRIFTDFEINVTMGRLHTITVYVTGHAAKPGAYAVSSMATLVDVLSQAGGPALSGSMRAIEVKRGGRSVAKFDAYDILLRGDRKGDVRLADGDIVFIPTVGALAAAAGNVKRPAIYELTGKERTVGGLIDLAGGLTSGAYKGRVQVVRVVDNSYRTAFETDIASPGAKNQPIFDGDLVKLFAVPGGMFTVRLAGAVVQPGVYAIEENVTTLADVIRRAGGLMYTAADEGELTRVTVSPGGPVTTRTMVRLKDIMNGNPITLRRDDYFFVRTVPDWNIYRSATITGRVLYPGSYAVKRGERLSSLIERAGGFAQDAFLRGAVFIRESIRADQQKNIDEMVAKLEREVMAAANQAISTAVKQQDVTFAQASVTQKEKYIDTLKNLKASGRLVISLPKDIKLIKGSAYDIELQEGDRLHIPDRPGTVQVIGSVLTPSAFVYRAGSPFTEYIKQAGGYNPTANPKRTYILKADGSTVRAFNGNKPRTLEEGDFVVVPEKLTFTPSLRNATDIMDILYKMVVGVAAIDYVFND